MLKCESLQKFISPKILLFNEAISKIKELKSKEKKVGLCHGGFDLLHPGHVIHFESAKKLCDVLFVSVTSDRFVGSRKGTGRPVFPEQLRAYSIAVLEMVDYVVVTDFAKGVEVIEQLQPNYYIKGPDFIGKTTPGITAEREAIIRIGGEMKYTNDPKLSTTDIIDYVKNQLDIKEFLIIIDRDGTIIENDDFFGKNESWKEELKFNEAVVSYISYLQTKYKTTKIVVTNQAGVARKYFTCRTVEEINHFIDHWLLTKGIKISNWQYCPDIDSAYANLKRDEIDFDFSYVKDKTKRKPNPEMVFDALKELKRDISEFNDLIVIGDREDDQKLAENLKCKFIDVNGKGYEDLLKEFS